MGMTKLAYLDCPTGLAGDMCLGALVHAGVPLDYIVQQLRRLSVGQEFELRVESVLRNGQAATKVHVELLKAAGMVDPPNWEAGVDPHYTFVHEQSHAATQAESTHTTTGAIAHSHTHAHSHSHTHAHAHSNGAEAAHTHTRTLADIAALIRAGHLPAQVEAWSLAIFQQLAEAEGTVHGKAADQIHFHEVGATDALVDVVGTCLGLDWLGIEAIYCSALPVGGGTLWAAHGRIPVPAPAVLKLFEMRQVPIYSNGIERELVTPTGAAIATTLAQDFGAPPPMRLQGIGLGAGSRDLQIPNILRLWIGESDEPRGDRPHTARHPHVHPHPTPPEPQSTDRSNTAFPDTPIPDPSSESDVDLGSTPSPASKETAATAPQTVIVLETQIDDVTPQAIAYATATLLSQGALDVFTQPVTMKKSRLGTLITVICLPDQANTCERILFEETTTLGIRRSVQQRTILDRAIQSIHLPYGTVRVKVARHPNSGELLNAHPEYDDCAQLAQATQLPWLTIHRDALQTWQQQLGIEHKVVSP
jgi:uncharacterized protein (TIGR00299 family) protein